MSGYGLPLDQSHIPRRFRVPPLPPKTDIKMFAPTTVRRGRGGKKRKNRVRKTRKTHRQPRRK